VYTFTKLYDRRIPSVCNSLLALAELFLVTSGDNSVTPGRSTCCGKTGIHVPQRTFTLCQPSLKLAARSHHVGSWSSGPNFALFILVLLQLQALQPVKNQYPLIFNLQFLAKLRAAIRLIAASLFMQCTVSEISRAEVSTCQRRFRGTLIPVTGTARWW